MSQRSMNPREFFRQLSSSSSQSPTSPGSSRTGMWSPLEDPHDLIGTGCMIFGPVIFSTTHKRFSFSPGKPFRRYQRSLTDTAFIFSKREEESTASSPRSSPLVSPFSRFPPSPFYRTTSPPRSPDFRPVTSPQSPRAPLSEPTSPHRPAPPLTALPSVPQTNKQVEAAVEPRAPSPAQPSAPPASPSLLASLSPSLEKSKPSQAHPETLPPSPPNTPTQPGDSAFCFEPLQVVAEPHPDKPQPNTGTVLTSDQIFELICRKNKTKFPLRMSRGGGGSSSGV